MFFAILSDIHSNLEALTTALDFIKKNFIIDKYFILGDVIGYGANPNECCEIIKQLAAVYLFGNHEYGMLNKLNLQWFNPLAREAIILTKAILSEENLNFIKTFNLIYKKNIQKNNLKLKIQNYKLQSYTLVHGSLTKEVEDYIFDKYDAEKCFKLMPTQICFFGHTHRTCCFIYNPQTKEIIKKNFWENDYLQLNNNFKYLINPGSIGQPRDKNPKLSFAIWNTEKNTVNFYRLDYDINICANKIIAAKFPEELATRLYLGY